MGDTVDIVIEGLPESNLSGETDSSPKTQNFSEVSLNITLVTIFIDILIGILANIATNALPNSLNTHAWLAWLVLALLIVVYFYLIFRATVKRDVRKYADFQLNKLARRTVKKVSPRRSIFEIINESSTKLMYRLHMRRYQKAISNVITLLDEYSSAIVSIQASQEKGELSKEVAEKAIEQLQHEFREKIKRN